MFAARGRVPARSEGALTFSWPSPGEWLGAGLGLAAATGLVLHDQIAMPTGVPDFGDPLLSAWRLGWFAHRMPLDPVHLFDANIYHPALRTLAYSDATLFQSAVAAPLVWLGAPLIVVYNGLLVASFFTAGLAMFALARAVTGSGGPAFVAALAFAFDPYRIAEYSHFEMQFTCWMPLAVLMLLRTLARGRLRDGLGTGVFVSLQALSSLYYGAYLSVSLVAVAVGWMWTLGWPSRRTFKALAVAALVPAIVAAALTQPYRANRATIGERGVDEIRFYSASMAHYLMASRQSAVYSMRLLDRRPDGLNLFTGATPLVLGAISFVPPASPFVAPVTLALLSSVDASFGLNGTVYSWLVRLAPFHGFRVPARFRAVAGVYLSLLAGLGVARLRWPRIRCTVVVGGTLLLLVEGYPTLELRPVWTHAPDIYAHLPKSAIVADLPLTEDGDSVFTYLSTFHWHPIVNGSSGFEPSWYGPLAAALMSFPDDRALDALTQVGTQYVVLHEAYYREQFAAISQAADAQPRLQFVAASRWEEGGCRLYRLVR
jgi:hypothetical protein